jgi:Anti-sigma-K factor rskA
MKELTEERLFDLLTQQAVEGLSTGETSELYNLENIFPQWKNDSSFELAATAFSLTNLDISENLPAHLQNKIIAESEKHLVFDEPRDEFQKTFAFEPKRSALSWLGWAFATVACIALAFNWSAKNVTAPPNVQVETFTASQLRQNLIDADKNAIKITWAKGNIKDLAEVYGDIVWSDIKQAGYMRFKGLPINDRLKETYQLWIFDETQDKKTPIDGGVFDVNSDGETIVPITAKLKVKNPKLFAVTVEKPGGVVVSKREKIPVLAKITT